MSSPFVTGDTEIRSQLARDAGTSNKIHSKQEERILRVMLSDEELSLIEIDREITCMKIALGALQRKREHCIDRINRYSVALSPHKHLLPEILSKIFVYSMTTQAIVLPPKYTDSPWALRWTCSRWRAIAVAEHRLWAHLDLQGVPPFFIPPVLHDLLPLIWTPTQTFPVSFSLKTHGTDLDLRNGMLPYSHRLSSVLLHAPLDDTCDFLFAPNISFTNLETLNIAIKQERQHLDVPPRALLSTFPQLKNIIIIDLSPNLHHQAIISRIPWPQLTHVTLYVPGIDFMGLDSILKHCENLLSLGVISPTSNPEVSPHEISIHLPKLQSFSLVTSETHRKFDILSCLRIPSLEKFTLFKMLERNSNNRSVIPWDQVRFSGLISRSGCNLESLNLNGVSDIPFESLLSELPHLTTLVMSSDNPLPRSVFEKMVRGEVLGNLQCLECTTLSPIAFLDLLTHQEKYPTHDGHLGLVSASVSYDMSEETKELSDMYEELRRKLSSVGKSLSKETQNRKLKLLLHM